MERLRKWSLMPRLATLFPEHRHYVSVFGGDGTDILCKPPSRLETFNDRDRHIYNLFTVLTDDAARSELERRLCSGRPDGNGRSKNDPIAAATAFILNIREGLHSADLLCSKSRVDLLEDVRKRFLTVQIENISPFTLVCNPTLRDALFFVDLPVDMPGGQREGLLAALNSIAGRVVLLGEANPDTGNGLSKWERRDADGLTVWLK